MKFLKILFIVSLLVFFSFDEIYICEKKEFTVNVDPDGIQRVEMIAGDYFFDPNYVIVKVNIPIEIKIKKKKGIIPHNFVLKAPEAGLDVNKALKTEPITIKIIPVKTGKYKYYCDKKLLFFKNHRERGMEGTLEVIE